MPSAWHRPRSHRALRLNPKLWRQYSTPLALRQISAQGFPVGNEKIMIHDHERSQGPRWGWARKKFGGGPPWSRMAGFGPFGAMPPRGGRMFGQGDLRLLLLALIADKPSHGYDLIRTIEARFGGSYSPSPGTIYPTLTLLEEQDLITPEADSGAKKSYAATQKGRDFLTENAEAVLALMTRIDIMAKASDQGPMPETLMQAIHTLRHALMAKSGGWSTEEETRVREILERAAKDIVGVKKTK